MTTKTSDSLPKTLPGVVCRQWVKCGRRNCRCGHGQLHGPYFYRFWRENGRLRKVYVRPMDVEAVRVHCEARRAQQRELVGAWKTWRGLVTVVRTAEAS